MTKEPKVHVDLAITNRHTSRYVLREGEAVTLTNETGADVLITIEEYDTSE